MPKNKRPVPRKSADAPELKDEQTTQALCALALDLAEQEDSEQQSAELRAKDAEFHKLIRKLLNQQKDEVLYGAIELAKFEDVGAYQFLRAAIEEAAATVQRRPARRARFPGPGRVRGAGRQPADGPAGKRQGQGGAGAPRLRLEGGRQPQLRQAARHGARGGRLDDGEKTAADAGVGGQFQRLVRDRFRRRRHGRRAALPARLLPQTRR